MLAIVQMDPIMTQSWTINQIKRTRGNKVKVLVTTQPITGKNTHTHTYLVLGEAEEGVHPPNCTIKVPLLEFFEAQLQRSGARLVVQPVVVCVMRVCECVRM